MSTAATSTEQRALKLLGSGVNAAQTAAALGVTESRISQLLANADFAGKVAELRYNELSSHTKRDAAYDEVEDELIERLKKSLGLIMRPEMLLKAIQVINGAKRRGQASQDSVNTQQNLVQVILPTQIIQQFTTNTNNQVVSAGEQSLETMQSGRLLKQVEGQTNECLPAPSEGQGGT